MRVFLENSKIEFERVRVQHFLKIECEFECEFNFFSKIECECKCEFKNFHIFASECKLRVFLKTQNLSKCEFEFVKTLKIELSTSASSKNFKIFRVSASCEFL